MHGGGGSGAGPERKRRSASGTLSAESWQAQDKISGYRLIAADHSAHSHNTTPHTSVAANMSKTQWKDIPVVPTSQEFLDIVLSRTCAFPPQHEAAPR